jgi:hypothetical protein
MLVQSETIRLTPSGVAALRQCGHRELWLREHPRKRVPFQESAASARGKSLHAALALFHGTGGAEERGPEELKRLLGRCWVREGYPDEEEERLSRLQCEAMLEAYYPVFGSDGGTLATERTWSFFRDLEGLRTEWYGRLDWVREAPEGGLEVVDWKARGQRLSPEALAADPVSVMYARLARSLAEREWGWAGGPVRFSLVYLGEAGAEKVSVPITRERVREAEAELARLARGLQAGRLAATEGVWCSWGCPVQAAGECALFPAVAVEGEW